MSRLAPTLQAFFTDRLINQTEASPRTIAAYRDTFRLLLAFTARQIGKQPSELDLDDLDARLIGAFLNHLQEDRGNTARTRSISLRSLSFSCCARSSSCFGTNSMLSGGLSAANRPTGFIQPYGTPSPTFCPAKSSNDRFQSHIRLVNKYHCLSRS